MEVSKGRKWGFGNAIKKKKKLMWGFEKQRKKKRKEKKKRRRRKKASEEGTGPEEICLYGYFLFFSILILKIINLIAVT